jgi:hypothetical protein
MSNQNRSEQDFCAMANRPGTMSMQEALPYVWTHPVSMATVGCDHPGHVEANADAARGVRALSNSAISLTQMH